jgi:hypothetical protein
MNHVLEIQEIDQIGFQMEQEEERSSLVDAPEDMSVRQMNYYSFLRVGQEQVLPRFL